MGDEEIRGRKKQKRLYWRQNEGFGRDQKRVNIAKICLEGNTSAVNWRRRRIKSDLRDETLLRPAERYSNIVEGGIIHIDWESRYRVVYVVKESCIF